MSRQPEPEDAEAGWRRRLAKRDALLAKRKAREAVLRAETKALKARCHTAETRCEAAEHEAMQLRRDRHYHEALAAGQLARPGLPPPLPLARHAGSWLHRWRRQRVWRHEMRLGVLCQHEPRPLRQEKLPPTREPATGWPTLSLVTPSWNQAAFLPRTLTSVLTQEYPALEYGVMDGGSTDGSTEIIAREAARLAWWQSQPDGGHTTALRDGFARTTGTIMAWLNSDDIFLPGTLRHVGAYFAAHPEVDVVYGHRVLIDEDDREIGRWVLPPHDAEMTRWGDYLPQETMFWRRAAYEKAGGMDPSFRFSMDWDLILRLQRTGSHFVRLPYFLGGFRVHSAQKSQTEIHSVGAEENARLRARELGGDFNELILERKIVAFQARALRCDRLFRLGLRW